MTWFTANQVSVNNGSTIVTVTSGEDISNIRAGDALIVGSFAPVEINRAYVDGSNNKIIELKSAWSDSNQSNAAARGFPTAGDFKEAANALRDATQLTSDQFQTLTDWGTINGTVTFTDSSGQQYTARSLAKMDADVAEIEATANSLVGSVVLPTKADFEARHEGKYAGAGFVEWGYHSSSVTEPNVNNGIYIAVNTAYTNGLWTGRGDGGFTAVGNSQYPLAYLAGCIMHITRVNTSTTQGRNFIKFPDAPDGLDKVDGTGRFASLAEAITAGGNSLSASVIHRQDLCILEVFDVNITTSGLPLYPYGNTQYGGSWTGVTLADNLVAQGYSAFHVGDTTTKGKGLLVNLTDDNHIKFLQNKDNNCYTDNGDIIQRQYRIRTIAGLEGDWLDIDWASSQAIQHSIGFRLKVQGTRINPVGLAAPDSYDYIGINHPNDKSSNEKGLYAANSVLAADAAYNGNCWAIPICLVQRRNKGAYHPSYNIAGSKSFHFSDGTGANKWYKTQSKKPLSVSDCFDAGSDYSTSFVYLYSGRIQDVNSWQKGRDDEKCYDAIYASDVLDLRLSAHKVNAEVTADNDARKGIGGTKRGWEAVPYTVTNKNYVDGVFKITGVALYNGLSNGHDRIQIPIDTTLAPNIYETISIFPSNHLQRNKVWVVGDNGNVMDAFGFNHLRHANGNCYMWTGYRSSRGNRVNEFNSKFPVGTTLTFIIENHVDYYQAEPTWTDIIADPDVLAATFPDGVAGQWVPVIPDGAIDDFLLSKKYITNSGRVKTTDNGGTWTSGTPSINTTTNTVTDTNMAATALSLVTYKAKANFTEPSAILPFIGTLPKTVFCGNHNATGYGNILHQSMFGKVATGVSEWARLNTALTIGNVSVTEANKISAAGDSEHVRHEPITIKNSNNSFAAKYAHFPVNVNGRLGVLWIAQEVKYDSAKDSASDFVHVDGTVTQTYTAGTVYRVSLSERIVIVKCLSNATSIFSNFDETEDGFRGYSGNALLFVFWDGNGYGDNGTFTVGDNMAVITDDNENSIVRATHLQMTQYLYTEGM